MDNNFFASVCTRVALVVAVSLPCSVAAQTPNTARPFDYPPSVCASCAAWNEPQAPLKIFGNTWWVGTHGLGAILITGPQGHILIDGAIPASGPSIIAHIRELHFLVEDVRLIVNSHDHFDHAGSIAELQRASGAEVAASAASARVLRAGNSAADDPQFGLLHPFEPVPAVRTISDGETLHVGSLAITAHFTPGHTPGGTTWTWRSCEGSVCKDMVYADSQTPVSEDHFLFTRNTTYPNALADFAHGADVLDHLPCDILITPHPSASNFWERMQAQTLTNPNACRELAATARKAVAERVAREKQGP